RVGMNPVAWLLKAAIHGYRLMIAPYLGTNCRYTLGCSSYALEAIEIHGAVYGAWLTIRRLGRCHPWGGSGYDPVPAKAGANATAMAAQATCCTAHHAVHHAGAGR